MSRDAEGPDSSGPPGSRRAFLWATAVLATGGTAGCSGLFGAGTEERTTTTATTSTTSTTSATTTESLDAGAPPINRRWPEGQALPHFEAGEALTVVDVRDRPAPERLLYATLQGVVNRRTTRLYVDLRQFPEGSRAWLDTLDIDYSVREDPAAVLRAYADELEGLIVYDPAVPATINVATTAAGVAGAAVASPRLAERLTADTDLGVVRDLRGRFHGASGAYRWQFDTLWTSTTDRMLVSLPPAEGRMQPVGSEERFRTLRSVPDAPTDGSNRGRRTVDLTQFLGGEYVYLRFDDAEPSTGGGADVWHLEATVDGSDVIAEFAPGTDVEELYLYDPDGSRVERTGATTGHRWASRDSYFVYRFSPPADASRLEVTVDVADQFEISATAERPPAPDEHPPAPFPLLRDYAVANRASVVWLDPTVASEQDLLRQYLFLLESNAPFLGWFPEGVAGEFSGVEICARNAAYVAPADYFENMSVFSGIRPELDPGAVPRPPTPPLENRAYVTIVMSDGDNLQYDQHRLRVLWDQDERGAVPINWSISPLLVDAAPALLDYYHRTATDNDLLMCGPSGVGYTYPAPWPNDEFGRYTEQTGAYLDRAGIDTMYLLNREGGEGVPLAESAAAAYERDVDPGGIYLPSDRAAVGTLADGLLRAKGPYVTSADGFVAAVRENTPGDWAGNRPLFIPVAPITWDMDTAGVVEAVGRLGEDYEPVRADHFFELYRQHDSG